MDVGFHDWTTVSLCYIFLFFLLLTLFLPFYFTTWYQSTKSRAIGLSLSISTYLFCCGGFLGDTQCCLVCLKASWLLRCISSIIGGNWVSLNAISVFLSGSRRSELSRCFSELLGWLLASFSPLGGSCAAWVSPVILLSHRDFRIAGGLRSLSIYTDGLESLGSLLIYAGSTILAPILAFFFSPNLLLRRSLPFFFRQFSTIYRPVLLCFGFLPVHTYFGRYRPVYTDSSRYKAYTCWLWLVLFYFGPIHTDSGRFWLSLF